MTRPAVTAFEIVRTYPAPRAAVWQAWRDEASFAQWWGPPGCTIDVARFEFRLGGFVHYAMNFTGAPTMWGRFNFRDIAEGERLVWLNSFANEHGGIARAPFSEECPLEIENTVVFTDAAGGGTTVTLRAAPFGETDTERRYFEALRPGLEMGYGGTFDQLGQHLAGT